MTVERVYSITNFYDGPKEGIANYAGLPHHYLYEWDEALDDYAGTFSLAPVDTNTMELALEQWNIWRKWEVAFHRGAVAHRTHPAFGGMDARYDELAAILKPRFKSIPRLPDHFRASFRLDHEAPDPEHGWLTSTTVEWTRDPDGRLVIR